MKLRDILKTEKDWTKDEFARDANGNPTDIDSGVCFCINGAIMKCNMENGTFGKIRKAISKLYPKRADKLDDVIVSFNDHPETTFDDVCNVIELAGV